MQIRPTSFFIYLCINLFYAIAFAFLFGVIQGWGKTTAVTVIAIIQYYLAKVCVCIRQYCHK